MLWCAHDLKSVIERPSSKFVYVYNINDVMDCQSIKFVIAAIIVFIIIAIIDIIAAIVYLLL